MLYYLKAVLIRLYPWQINFNYKIKYKVALFLYVIAKNKPIE